MNKLRKLWLDLNSSLWFLPALIVAGSIALALLLVEADKFVGAERLAGYPRFFGVEPSGSRDMLATVAGSMITVAGIVFSIVIVALSLASTQYTPRILRNFMRDQTNQVVLGVFVGIFTYCIVVLRTIRDGDDNDVFVPSIAVIVAVLLALVGIGFLIYFIHHIAVSIQASSIVAAIAEETIEVIEELFPHRLGENAQPEQIEVAEKFVANAAWQIVPATSTGYIQNIDHADLLQFTKKHNTVVQMERGVGEFVIAGAPLALIADATQTSRISNDKALIKRINGIYAIDSFRTIDQDVAFGIRQIVDIVMKALSPGINDTTTAVISIDYLTAIVAHFAAHEFPTEFRFADNRLQAVARRPSFEDLLDLAFNQVRQNARDNVAVILRTLHALEQIWLRIEGKTGLHNSLTALSLAERRTRLEAVANHLHMVADKARRNIESGDDWTQVTEHITKVFSRLNLPSRAAAHDQTVLSAQN